MGLTYLYLICIAIIGAAAQLALKKGAENQRLALFFMQPWIVAGALLMVLNVIFLAMILKTTPLTTAMPVTALVYVFTPLGASIFFKEKKKTRFWGGTLLIVLGISLVTLSRT